MKKISTQIIAILVLFTVVFSPFAARKANAQWLVADPSLIVKDYGLDSVAWILANLVIERMSASTVNWINSGFKGSPAYVTDPAGYYKDLGNKIAGQYIFSNPNLNFLCGPISARVRLALAQNYIYDNQIWQCKLTDAVGNMEDFLGDFRKGGWDKFFTMTQNPTQNPIGAYLVAQNELSAEISTRQGQKRDELSWGNGFMSWKECVRYDEASRQTGTPAGGSVLQDSMVVYGPDGTPISTYSDSKIPDNPPNCLEERTNTPGSVIQTKLNDVLNIGNDKLAVSDEINEIVSALLNQLVNQVVGGVGRGLRGLSTPSTTNNNQTFTSQLVNRQPGDQIVDYFGSTTDTTILDVPFVPSSFGVDPAQVLNSGDIIISGTNTSNTPTPLDRDCANVSPTTVKQMAEEQLGHTPTNQDIINFDCDPVGIN